MNKGQQLGQSRPANTTAVSIYSPDGDEAAKIFEIIVCNTTTSDATYRIFHDEDGTTYNQTTALFYDVNLTANSTDILELNAWMNDSTGNLAVRTGTNSAITFTVNGEVLAK